jgi:hypothetical protein
VPDMLIVVIYLQVRRSILSIEIDRTVEKCIEAEKAIDNEYIFLLTSMLDAQLTSVIVVLA